MTAPYPKMDFPILDLIIGFLGLGLDLGLRLVNKLILCSLPVFILKFIPKVKKCVMIQSSTFGN